MTSLRSVLFVAAVFAGCGKTAAGPANATPADATSGNDYTAADPEPLPVCAAPAGQAADGMFEDPTLQVVFSATDKDAQLIISGGSPDPLSCVRLVGPGGTVPFSVQFHDEAAVGQADFRFDSPEPTLDQLKAAYPAGTYAFEGLTLAGKRLRSEVLLAYDLLDPPVLISPKADAIDVPIDGLVIEWTSPPNTKAVHVEVEDEVAKVKDAIDLLGDVTTFRVPDGWLVGGATYVVDVKLIGPNGHITVSDVSFTVVAAGTSGAVPAGLLQIEGDAEDAYDKALIKDWTSVGADAVKIDAGWKAFRAQAIDDGAKQTTVDVLDAAVPSLTSTAEGSTDPATVARAANAVSSVMEDLFTLYNPVAPPAIIELDYLGREVFLDALSGDFSKANDHAATMVTRWADVKPLVVAAGGTKAADDYTASLSALQADITAADGKAVQDEANIGLELVDALEAVFEKK